MNIRPYELSDIELIKPLFEEFTALNKSLSYRHDAWDGYSQLLKKQYDKSDFVVMVIEAENQIIGFSVGMIQKNKPLYSTPYIGFIGMFIVTMEFRRQGLGTKLYQELINWFLSKNIHEIHLTTEFHNETAKVFWDSLGFNVRFEERIKSIKSGI